MNPQRDILERAQLIASAEVLELAAVELAGIASQLRSVARTGGRQWDPFGNIVHPQRKAAARAFSTRLLPVARLKGGNS